MPGSTSAKSGRLRMALCWRRKASPPTREAIEAHLLAHLRFHLRTVDQVAQQPMGDPQNLPRLSDSMPARRWAARSAVSARALVLGAFAGGRDPTPSSPR
jgi:hypothetical protein